LGSERLWTVPPTSDRMLASDTAGKSSNYLANILSVVHKGALLSCRRSCERLERVPFYNALTGVDRFVVFIAPVCPFELVPTNLHVVVFHHSGRLGRLPRLCQPISTWRKWLATIPPCIRNIRSISIVSQSQPCRKNMKRHFPKWPVDSDLLKNKRFAPTRIDIVGGPRNDPRFFVPSLSRRWFASRGLRRNRVKSLCVGPRTPPQRSHADERYPSSRTLRFYD
jgi:hypothetical protein